MMEKTDRKVLAVNLSYQEKSFANARFRPMLQLSFSSNLILIDDGNS